MRFIPTIDKDGELDLKEQLLSYFDTPEALEEYIKEQKIQQKKIKGYEKWLSVMEWQVTQNEENYPSRNIWDNLIHQIGSMWRDDVNIYQHLQDCIYTLAKKIILRCDLKNRTCPINMLYFI